MRNLDWSEGAPDELVPGMVIDEGEGNLVFIGHCLPEGYPEMPDGYLDLSVKRWAWLIQPYQLEWLEAMTKQHRKGKA